MNCAICNFPHPPCELKDGLWDELNKARGFGWDSNPWVWAYTFKMVKP